MALTPFALVRIDLQTPDWAVQSALSVEAGPAPIETWLPFLHALASKAALSAEEEAERAGKRVSCKKGCGTCCRQLVGISFVEARALAKLVADMPEPRQTEIRRRFAEALGRVAGSGVLGRDFSIGQAFDESPLIETEQQRLGAAWFGLGIACPFLENESCSIHDSRPLVCREYQVTSPSDVCSRLYREPVERVEMSVHLGQSLARATAKIAAVSVAMIPLVMALQLPAEIDAALSHRHDVIGMLEILLGEIGDWRVEQQVESSVGRSTWK
jgi:Fe-S-cluster containining protein